MKTKSERIFECLCSVQGLKYEKIEEGASKTPDYHVQGGCVQFIAEVKEVNPNNEQRKRLAEFERKRFIVTGGTPGEKVRSKITSSARQISKLAKGRMPGLLVLYNNLPFALGDPFEPYNIRVGMFGFDTIVLTRPRDFARPRVLDRRFGPKRKITKEHNTSISAVAVINKREPLRLDVYHNPYASIPFKPGFFEKLGNKEFQLEQKRPMAFQEWTGIGS